MRAGEGARLRLSMTLEEEKKTLSPKKKVHKYAYNSWVFLEI